MKFDPKSLRPMTPPAPGERLSWRRVARALALGKTTDEVAEEFGVPAQRVRRNLRRSQRFRDYIKEETDMVAQEADRRAAALPFRYSEALAQALDKGDPKLLLWIGERLGIPRGKAGGSGEMTPEAAAQARAQLAERFARFIAQGKQEHPGTDAADTARSPAQRLANS